MTEYGISDKVSVKEKGGWFSYMNNRKETKHEKFVRIVEARTNKAAEMIRLIGNCANKGTYDYSENDVKKIFTYLEKELKNARAKYSGTEGEEDRFTL